MLMTTILVLSLAVSAWSFVRIVRGYRRLDAFPWLFSIVFAAASTAALFALRALLAS